MTLSRRKFLKLSAISAFGTAVVGIAGFAYAHDIEPEWVEVVPVELRLPRLDAAFDGYRIAHISDIHVGTGMTGPRLKHIAELVNAQETDATVITGDFVTHGDMSTLAPPLLEGLSALKASDGVYAVLGNHDHWTNSAAVRTVLRQAGIVELENSLFTLRRGAASLHVCGVDDHWEQKDRLDAVLAVLPDDGAAILLAHEPDFADISAATGRFDLQVSGHTHGGQVRLPLINRPLKVPRYGRKYSVGLYTVGTMLQYTNRGLGTIAPAVRFNCRPEITVYTLRSPEVVSR
ncbi:MAG: metallophosphoesterase [Anaerolineae bacterium]|nr:metallophosphoesterase [Anaerolineae bacterium]